MVKNLILSLCLVGGYSALGTTKVAVIDSGLDYKHPKLEELIWYNPGETPGNEIDDENNGYIDDIRGWNFANQSPVLIDYAEDEFYSSDVAKFMDIQTRSLIGKSTLGERRWAQKKLKDRRFLGQISRFLNYAHGTHVAGIMTNGITDTEVIDIRVIPVRTVPEGIQKIIERVRNALSKDQDLGFIKEFVFKTGLYALAQNNSKMFADIADYLAAQDVRVANASVGMGINQVRGLITPILALILQENPEPDLVDEYARFFLEESVKAQQKAFERSPNTLFVFAAGNDGFDNDEFPTAPASVGLTNTISVGATIDTVKLAPFSNTGALNVDVFAPGVGITSAAPMGKTIRMSGTSQAAPYVANIASQVASINPELTPEDLKQIILETTDRKDFLEGLAYSEGTVNKARALKAAKLSISQSLTEAIQQSKATVSDVKPNIEADIESYLVGTPLLPSFL